MNPSATALMLMQTANVRSVPPIPAMSTRPFLADYRLMSEDRRRTGALDPNRSDATDRFRARNTKDYGNAKYHYAAGDDLPFPVRVSN
jgi:hypothetical protein